MTVQKNNDPYGTILEKMKEHPIGIPMKDGKISEAFKE